MSPLSKKSYIEKYIGKKNAVRTATLQNKGIDMKKYSIKPTAKVGIKKIVFKKGNDTTGYIIKNEVFTPKSKYDRSHKTSKEPWSRGSKLSN
jgi:hypothetical protein